MPDILLFTITFGFLSGVFGAHDFIVGIASGVVLVIGTIYFSRRTQELFAYHKYLFVILIFIAAFVFGYFRYMGVQVHPTEYFLSHEGLRVEVTGVIKNDPDEGDGVAVALIWVDGIGLRLKIKTTTELRYGDTITVSGTLTLPENFMTDQGTEFDYVTYLSKDSILYIIPDGKLISYTKDTTFSLTRILYTFRHLVESKLFTYMPKQQAGFVAGILLGTKTAIDTDLYDALVRTSTVHVIALSGYNVSIVAESITQTLVIFLPRFVASLLGGFGIILFVLMTGASSTALRAGLMALLMILSRITGRPTYAMRVMAMAACILVFINPMYLIADVSFQLSFLATLGLLIVSPTYVSWLEKRIPATLAEMVGTTLAAETAVAPFIMYKMGLFSVISLPVNLIIIPFIPYLMLLGFILICISFTIPFLGGIVGYPVSLLTSGIIVIITTASGWSLASIKIPHISLAWAFLFYVVITWFFISRLLAAEN